MGQHVLMFVTMLCMYAKHELLVTFMCAQELPNLFLCAADIQRMPWHSLLFFLNASLV